MTNYEKQIRFNTLHADRITWVAITGKMLMWVVDAYSEHPITYIHLFDENGKCIEAHWSMAR